MTRYLDRRKKLLERHPGTLFVLPSMPVARRNRTVEHPYRTSSDLLYLAGVDEPEVVLVFGALGSGEAVERLYARPFDALAQRWEGNRAGHEALSAASGVGDVRPASAFFDELLELLVRAQSVAWRLGIDLTADLELCRLLDGAWRKRRRLDDHVPAVLDPGALIGPMRLRKDAEELAWMRQAAAVTVAGFEEVRGRLKSGVTELTVAGWLEGAFRTGGAHRTAYNTIVAGAQRACCLHAMPSPASLVEGSYVLIDAGAEWNGYACDVTRTYRVGSPTSDATAALHQVVSAAHAAAIETVRPGATLEAVHRAACEIFAQELPRLGLPGPVDRWFCHPTSHWIGLDVHDVGRRVDTAGEPVVLEPGMCFSVEPGLYIDGDASDAPEALRGVGIRIEDTVAVTAGGREVLTVGAV